MKHLNSVLPQLLVGFTLTACGTEEDKVLPGDSDTFDQGDGAAGEPDAVDCSMDDGTCPEPCRATWAVRYDAELQCLAADRSNGSAGTMLFSCQPPDELPGQAFMCVCNAEGQCGLSGQTVPAHRTFTLCDAATSNAATDAMLDRRSCPPGHFE